VNELPSTWRWDQLADVADVRLGRQRSPKVHTGDSMRPYLRAANITWSGLDLTDVKVMNFTDSEMTTYRLLPGDLLLSEASGSAGEVGKPAIWSGEIAECAFQNTLLRVRPRMVDPRYLFHYFRYQALTGRFVPESRGVGINHLGRTRLANWKVPVAPWHEQLRIVHFVEDQLSRLDRASSEVRATSARIGNLRRAHQLRLVLGAGRVELGDVDLGQLGGPEPPAAPLPAGWRWKKWKEVGASKNGRAFPSSDYSSSGVPLLRPGNMGPTGRLCWTERSTRHLPERYAASHPDLLLEPRDIVMNLTAQSLKDDFLGRVCMVGDDRALLNQRILRLRARDLSPEYALLIFQSPLFRSYVKTLNTGSLIQHMFSKQVDEFWMPVPPPEYQGAATEISKTMVEGTDRLVGAINTTDRRARALERAALQAAFSGRLTDSSALPDRIEEIAGV